MLARVSIVVGVLAATLTAAAAPAGAAPRGANQLQLVPSPASLRFGATPSYVPAAGVPVRIEIRATGSRGKRLLGRKLRGRMGGLGRCASSYARGDGERLTFRRGEDFRGARFQGSGSVQLQASPNLRFCLWFARGARDRVEPVTRTVNVAPRLFGAVMSYIGRFGVSPGGPNLVVAAAATVPFATTKTGPCPGDEPETDDAGVASISGLYESSTLFQNWTDSCAGSLTMTYAPGVSQTYSREEYFGPKPLKTIGDCFTGAAIGLDEAQAKAYLSAVGCRPGRVTSDNSANRRERDEVFEFRVEGARATLVPPGTTVDIVTAR